MANERNLIPMNQRSKKEARENGRKGGKRSGEVRREKKRLTELLKLEVQLLDKESGIANEIIIVKNLVERAKTNDNSLVIVRDMLGEQPSNKHEVVGDFNINDAAHEIERRLFKSNRK